MNMDHLQKEIGREWTDAQSIKDLDFMLKDAGKNSLPPNSVKSLSKTSLDFAKIEEYLKNTQADRSMSIVEAYRVCPRQMETEMSMGNRHLLWHGTPTRNIAGILETGMQIRPPGVDVSGSRLGDGCYFADMAFKLRKNVLLFPAAFYCRHQKQGDEAILILAEVALGTIQEQWKEDGTCPLREGFDAVHALGRHYPDPAGHWAHPDGFCVPLGKAIVEEGPFVREYNEFIVYSTPQVRLKYLLRVRMEWIH